jgi:rubrerythrin
MEPSSIKSFNDILQFAIEKEEEAAQLYGDLAAKSDKTGLKEMFSDLSKQELGHKARLQSLDLDCLPGKGQAEVPNLKISDYLDDVEVTADSSYQDILIFAMKREESAVALYSRLAGDAQDEGAKALFETLAQEEMKHKNRLETEYDENVLKEN